MKFTNSDFTETTHSTLKLSERQHNFHVNRMLRTPAHREKAMKSIVWHNTRKAGFTPPSMFKLRKSYPYGMSPNLNKDISSNFHFLIAYNCIDFKCMLVVKFFCQRAGLLQVWHPTLHFRDRVLAEPTNPI